jgi:hypothetical protein
MLALTLKQSINANMREIFSVIINEAPHISLSQNEMKLLVKYKHYREIRATIGKTNKRNFMSLFFDADIKAEEKDKFETCTLAYYVDVMLQHKDRKLEDVKEFITHFHDQIIIDDLAKSIIKHNKFDLVQWMET